MMLQYSVYVPVCRGEEAVDKHLGRVRKHLPPEGSVRALQVTDQQYGRMKLLIKARKKNEKVAQDQLVLLWFLLGKKARSTALSESYAAPSLPVGSR